MKFWKIKIAAVCCLFSFKSIGQVDTTPPTVVCMNGMLINSMGNWGSPQPPSVTLWATDFLIYAEDDLTDPTLLVFALRDPDINPGVGFPTDSEGMPQAQLHLDCSQIGTNLVELWAMDEAGNTAFCAISLILSDNSGSCASWPNPPGKPICITSAYCPTGVSEVKVFAHPLPFVGLPNLFPGGITDDSGCFFVNTSTMPATNQYRVFPEKYINPLNGVSMADLSQLEKHLSGVQPFNSPFQFAAADANNDLVVSAADVVELEKLILGIYIDFPVNNSWRFVLKNQGFGSPNWYSNWLEYCDGGPSDPCNFDGVKIGDLTGNAACDQMIPEILLEYRAPARFFMENRELKSGQSVVVPIFSESELSVLAWQLALKFDPDFIEIEEAPTPGLGGLPMVARTTPGRAAMGWFSASPRTFLVGRDALISLKINVLRDCKLADVLFLENENLAPEAYFSDEKSHPISLVFSDKKPIAAAQNLTAWPNPFSENTTLEWPLLEAAEVSIDVFDATGRAVFSTKFLGEKGANRYLLDGLSDGLFFVKIQSFQELFTTIILKK